jgi:hypothetical protein
MITFDYLQLSGPPAPFVSVSVGHPHGPGTVEWVPARVDSAADRTVIPFSIAETLQLEPMGQMTFEGVGGHPEVMDIYSVRLAIRGLTHRAVEVAVHRGERHVLLGRDVLNVYRVVLDGPNCSVESIGF